MEDLLIEVNEDVKEIKYKILDNFEKNWKRVYKDFRKRSKRYSTWNFTLEVKKDGVEKIEEYISMKKYKFRKMPKELIDGKYGLKYYFLFQKS